MTKRPRRHFLFQSLAAAATGGLAAPAPGGEMPADKEARPVTPSTPPEDGPPLCISGVMPRLAVKADLLPRRSETGIGALMPWAGKLWLVSYVSHKAGTGAGTGLFEIGEALALTKHPQSIVGTYANRMIHAESNQLIIGPHVIDTEGSVRTIKEFRNHRLTATMEHLHDPGRMVYFLTMEGLVFEADVKTLRVAKMFDLVKELGIPRGRRPHFKGGHTGSSRVVVANNTYDERDFLGRSYGGRLAEWHDGTWRVLERTAFNEVAGRRNLGQVVFATGWDHASAILKVFAAGAWSTYRLPKASHCFDHCWQTEWPRIREVETERYLMDCHGMFYELSPIAYAGKVWGVRPISTHLRIVPDFCSWRGLLVLAGNQVSPNGDSNLLAGEPQAGLWLGKTDDLWQWGKPKGWGGPWRNSSVSAGQPSDPFLMTGFDHKVLHLASDADRAVQITIEIDFLGDQSWQRYDALDVPPHGYVHHEFPPGFSGHWARVTADTSCTATAYFTYT